LDLLVKLLLKLILGWINAHPDAAFSRFMRKQRGPRTDVAKLSRPQRLASALAFLLDTLAGVRPDQLIEKACATISSFNPAVLGSAGKPGSPKAASTPNAPDKQIYHTALAVAVSAIQSKGRVLGLNTLTAPFLEAVASPKAPTCAFCKTFQHTKSSSAEAGSLLATAVIGPVGNAEARKRPSVNRA